jgi:hypothetical protein
MVELIFSATANYHRKAECAYAAAEHEREKHPVPRDHLEPPKLALQAIADRPCAADILQTSALMILSLGHNRTAHARV